VFEILTLESSTFKKPQICGMIINLLFLPRLAKLVAVFKKEQHTFLPENLVVDDTQGLILNSRTSEIHARTLSTF